MGRARAWLMGAGAGAALMYWLDPDRGRRRRAFARDKAVHLARVERELAGKALRDLDHRREGVAHFVQSFWSRSEPADEVVAERIRATLGRFSSHPRSVRVGVKAGVASLSGPILAREADKLLGAVRGVPGVLGVEDHLERHDQPGNVPGLQGEGLRVPRKRRLLRGDNWMPAVRLLAGGVGVAAGVSGIYRRGFLGGVLLAGGSLLALRALTNRPLRTLFTQTHDESGALHVQKSIAIDAPVETVYSYFRNFENLARFMDHVEEVHAQNAHSSWKVRGPAGTTVAFDVEITRDQPNRLIAWRTLPGRGFEHSGVARFESLDGGRTRLEIDLSYGMPGGRLGDWVASLFRVDPKHALDEDLIRFKSILERGKTHAHQQAVTRSELNPV